MPTPQPIEKPLPEAYVRQILDPAAPQEPLTPEQESFLNRYSWAALVFQYAYFGAMGDFTYTGLSFITSFIPVVSIANLYFPARARRRAWELRRWPSFEEFARSQRSWDRSAWILLILGIAFLFALLLFIAPYFGDATQNLQEILGLLNNQQ